MYSETREKIVLFAYLFAVVVSVAYFVISNTADANPLYFFKEPTAAATTTVVYMSSGTATTTLSLDLNKSGVLRGANGLNLAIQWNASSTVSKLNWYYEYSRDGVDWYREQLGTIATSTTVGTAPIYNWTATAAGNNYRVFTVPTPQTQYVRAVFTVPASASSSALWAEFIGTREQN